jgi:hypothetical protein
MVGETDMNAELCDMVIWDEEVTTLRKCMQSRSLTEGEEYLDSNELILDTNQIAVHVLNLIHVHDVPVFCECDGFSNSHGLREQLVEEMDDQMQCKQVDNNALVLSVCGGLKVSRETSYSTLIWHEIHMVAADHVFFDKIFDEGSDQEFEERHVVVSNADVRRLMTSKANTAHIHNSRPLFLDHYMINKGPVKLFLFQLLAEFVEPMESQLARHKRDNLNFKLTEMERQQHDLRAQFCQLLRNMVGKSCIVWVVKQVFTATTQVFNSIPPWISDISSGMYRVEAGCLFLGAVSSCLQGGFGPWIKITETMLEATLTWKHGVLDHGVCENHLVLHITAT